MTGSGTREAFPSTPAGGSHDPFAALLRLQRGIAINRAAMVTGFITSGFAAVLAVASFALGLALFFWVYS